MSRPKHTPTEKTRKRVESMVAVGIPQEEVAVVVGIDVKTLRKHYRQELDEAMIRANAAVAGKLYSTAMGGDVRAQIFWCKTRLGWRETSRVEVEQKEDLSKLSTEELEQRLAQIETDKRLLRNHGRTIPA